MLNAKLKKNIEKHVSKRKNALILAQIKVFCVKTQFFLLKNGVILINLLLLQHKPNKRGVRFNQTLPLRSYTIYKIELQNQKKD